MKSHKRLLKVFFLAVAVIAVAAAYKQFVISAPSELAKHSSTVQNIEPNGKVIIMTHSEQTNSVTHELAVHFKERLEHISNGELRVSIYGENTLGSLNDGINGISNGTFEMRLGMGPSKIMRVVTWLPSILGTSSQIIDQALASNEALKTMIEAENNADGVYLLGMMPSRYRILTNNGPVETLTDLKGMKIRTINAGIESDFWECLGAEPSAFNIEQVYMALQQGIVEAQENTIPSIVSNKIYECQTNVIRTNHKVYFDSFYINLDYYNSLTDAERTWIAAAVSDTIEFGRENLRDYERDGLETIIESGVEVSALSDTEKQKMIEIASPILVKSFAESYGADFVNDVIDQFRYEIK
ncbi:TRAP transporter substrate-binding protein [Fusibacter paucivorans]|uniref:TRAP transporter substrate-binding protein n=1 Tax=Fusibacter paucivorans TaxID=76009 RepID=A0ABS5PMI2_9FIRM|nr:TRAP transporter substrate-binding protein [Fusibacter paucivorans]MBS7526390.1 TRAP transporter substrate-binding protein [Fusibacter paucivorans]